MKSFRLNAFLFYTLLLATAFAQGSQAARIGQLERSFAIYQSSPSVSAIIPWLQTETEESMLRYFADKIEEQIDKDLARQDYSRALVQSKRYEFFIQHYYPEYLNTELQAKLFSEYLYSLARLNLHDERYQAILDMSQKETVALALLYRNLMELDKSYSRDLLEEEVQQTTHLLYLKLWAQVKINQYQNSGETFSKLMSEIAKQPPYNQDRFYEDLIPLLNEWYKQWQYDLFLAAYKELGKKLDLKSLENDFQRSRVLTQNHRKKLFEDYEDLSKDALKTEAANPYYALYLIQSKNKALFLEKSKSSDEAYWDYYKLIYYGSEEDLEDILYSDGQVSFYYQRDWQLFLSRQVDGLTNFGAYMQMERARLLADSESLAAFLTTVEDPILKRMSFLYLAELLSLEGENERLRKLQFKAMDFGLSEDEQKLFLYYLARSSAGNSAERSRKNYLELRKQWWDMPYRADENPRVFQP